MITGVIRNNNQKDKVIDWIKDRPLPIKFMFEPVYPTRSVEQNAYLFGVVYKKISEHTGHNLVEVHQGYKEKFLVEYSPDVLEKWQLRIKSTTEFSTISIMEYAMMVRADAEIEYGIQIELPNELFNQALYFSEEMQALIEGYWSI
jgi:hypothetical protein